MPVLPAALTVEEPEMAQSVPLWPQRAASACERAVAGESGCRYGYDERAVLGYGGTSTVFRGRCAFRYLSPRPGTRAPPPLCPSFLSAGLTTCCAMHIYPAPRRILAAGSEEDGRPVAVKVLQLAQGSAEWKVLQREIAITQQISAHRHIVTLLDTLFYFQPAAGRSGRAGLVLELCSAGPPRCARRGGLCCVCVW